jgi:hypothetical protein
MCRRPRRAYQWGDAKLGEEGEGPHLDQLEVIFRQVLAYASSLHFGARIVFTSDG